jgi:hypothetical protein
MGIWVSLPPWVRTAERRSARAIRAPKRSHSETLAAEVVWSEVIE